MSKRIEIVLPASDCVELGQGLTEFCEAINAGEYDPQIVDKLQMYGVACGYSKQEAEDFAKAIEDGDRAAASFIYMAIGDLTFEEGIYYEVGYTFFHTTATNSNSWNLACELIPVETLVRIARSTAIDTVMGNAVNMTNE